MRHKLYVVGVGPGAPDQLTPRAREIIGGSALIVASPRYRNLACGHSRVVELGNFDAAFDAIDAELDRNSAAVLVSGDTGVFSLLPLLKKRFPRDEIEAVPGISSLQTLCARLAQTWADAKILSGHGRALSEAALLDAADGNAKTIFFCGPEWKPERVCAALAASGIHGLRVTIGERLGYDDERLTTGTPEELREHAHDALALVFVENPDPWTPPLRRPLDADFIRSAVPMTGETVRGAVLDALGLSRDSVLWDLGAGTGSVSVAAALECVDGRVCAVEKNPEAAALIRANRAKFHRHNVSVHEEDNLAAFPSLPAPTHVFIGGGLTPTLLDRVRTLGRGIRVVATAVALKTWSECARTLGGDGFHSFDAVTVAVTRLKTIGGTPVMAARNPVTIFSAVTGREAESSRVADSEKGGN